MLQKCNKVILPLLFIFSAFNETYAEEYSFAGAEIEEYKYISKTTGLSKVEQVKTNVIYDHGKKINTNKIEYIEARSYNHHDSDWTSIDHYRIYEKYDEGVNAYAFTSVSPDYLGVLTLGKYNQDVHLRTHTLKKGTVEISPYFLVCNKEREKNPNLRNRYFYYIKNFRKNDDSTTLAEVTSDSNFIREKLDLICKHTYTDKTNGDVKFD